MTAKLLHLEPHVAPSSSSKFLRLSIGASLGAILVNLRNLDHLSSDIHRWNYSVEANACEVDAYANYGVLHYHYLAGSRTCTPYGVEYV